MRVKHIPTAIRAFCRFRQASDDEVMRVLTESWRLTRRLDRDPAALCDARLAQGILKLLLRHFRAAFDTGGFGTLV
jgi:hypothetical protein